MFGMAREANAIVTIAYRDILKFSRDPSRLIATLVLPVLFIGLFGEGLQATLGPNLGYDYLTFVFLGVLSQTLFQSTALGPATYQKVVLASPAANLLIMFAMFVLFLVIGTTLFVRIEQNK